MTTGVLPAPTPIAGLPGAVCCFHHAWTTGRQDQVDVRVMHQRVRQFYRRLIDPANQVLRRAGRDGSLQHDISRFVGGFFCTRVREKMMALRVFRLMSDLKMAVEVGLVVGTIPQMMPIGSAIVMVPKGVVF
ncbi:Uncharacterised protein [Klebsiella pneumoniae subsp. pneumoniae]|nr:Uncharacterised protein [Klebsiella pneumoniae subsp. pneumoniae]